ncbi:hypothetical protein J1N35_005862 [Gossypium stocksii]|uniref:Uncharacterized protein n=1 Tax=Gossypium stocksii TaxID=47602 RepID=A0A9D4AHI0_9ROSI|nr:hypothetical protein J1N35_005862 [Gossypium stocksii]
MGGCYLLLQSWALYRMQLALMSHQPLSWPFVNRWTTLPGIGRSYIVTVYCQMIEIHSRDKTYHGSKECPVISPLELPVIWFL